MAIEKGDKIKVDYEGKLDSGEVFDTSQHEGHSHPLEFVVGEGKVIPGFEQAVIGMNEGEEKEFKIEAKDAYGEPNPENKKDFPKDQVPLEQEPQPGMVLAVNTPDGKQFPVKIHSVDEEKITLDLNHPLAGENLNFNIKVAGIEKPSEQSQESEKPSEEPQEKEESLEDMASEEKQE